MANVIICCDGTWNTFDQRDGGLPAPTNIAKIYAALAKKDATGRPQKKFYRKGVGTSGSKLIRQLDGAIAASINNDIISTYKALADLYRKGDKIFLFGFSRGAYAARSLSGLIEYCGIPDVSNLDPTENRRWDIAKTAFELYRTKLPNDSKDRAKDAMDWIYHDRPKVEFLGVFDTVGALGIPDDGWFLKLVSEKYLRRVINLLNTPILRRIIPKRVRSLIFKYLPKSSQFHDVNLSSTVQTARHALGIDERRVHFQPTLWNKTPPNADVQQVWFPGVHSDIGGGYASSGLSDTTLKWMLEEAQEKGLAVNQTYLDQLTPNSKGVLNESVTSVFKKLSVLPRSVPDLNLDAPQYKVHVSARNRRDDRPVKQPNYWTTRNPPETAPQTLTIKARRRWHPTGLHLKAGTTYRFRAEGEWLDGSAQCSPAGFASGTELFGPIKVVGPAVLEFFKRKLIKRYPKAPVPLTRRHLEINWFCLTGVVANGRLRETPDEADTAHEHFPIGERAEFTPSRDGWLYCYPNDAWNWYQNNKGSVTLTVSKK